MEFRIVEAAVTKPSLVISFSPPTIFNLFSLFLIAIIRCSFIPSIIFLDIYSLFTFLRLKEKITRCCGFIHSSSNSIFEKRRKLYATNSSALLKYCSIMPHDHRSQQNRAGWGGKWWWRISRHVLGIELFLPNAFKPAALPELII